MSNQNTRDKHEPLFRFNRYVNGVLMAEGVTIEREKSLEAAIVVALRIAPRGPDGEAPVLVYVPDQREAKEPKKHMIDSPCELEILADGIAAQEPVACKPCSGTGTIFNNCAEEMGACSACDGSGLAYGGKTQANTYKCGAPTAWIDEGVLRWWLGKENSYSVPKELLRGSHKLFLGSCTSGERVPPSREVPEEWRAELIEKIEEYGRDCRDAGMDAVTWDRARDAVRKDSECETLLSEIRALVSKGCE